MQDVPTSIALDSREHPNPQDAACAELKAFQQRRDLLQGLPGEADRPSEDVSLPFGEALLCVLPAAREHQLQQVVVLRTKGDESDAPRPQQPRQLFEDFPVTGHEESHLGEEDGVRAVGRGLADKIDGIFGDEFDVPTRSAAAYASACATAAGVKSTPVTLPPA